MNKKRLMTLSMVGLLTMTLASCSDVSAKTDTDGKQVIVTVGNEDYTADDLLAKYSKTSDGVDAYYNAIYDVLVRSQQEITSSMKTTVENKIDEFTKTVKRNASSNGVTYKTELSNELEEKGVETLAELSELYTLEEQKTKFEEDWYSERIDYEDGKDSLTVDYLAESSPYHIKHILVKTENAGSSLYNGTISEAEALKLSSVVERLASGKESFGQIAQQASDDSGSAAKYGSIGIVDLDSNSSYVSEFKYGCYAYDTYFDTHTNGATKTAAEITADRVAKLNIPATIEYKSVSSASTTTINVADTLKTIAEIPYTAIEDLKKYADKTKTEDNLTYIPDGANSVWGTATVKNISKLAGQTISEDYYPRNVIFNNYFNDHGLYVITEDGYTGTDTSRFEEFANVSSKKILTDGNHNPILVTRAGSGYQGVHFMVIEQSAFWYDEARLTYSKPWKDLEATAAKPSVNDYLRYYYSTDLPATSTENVTYNQKFVTFLKSNRNTYSESATSIENAVKSFDSNIKYKMYESLVEKAGSKITISESIKTSINEMIAEKRASAAYTKEQSNLASWKSYVELLTLQDQEKAAKQLDLNFIKMYDKTYTATAVKY